MRISLVLPLLLGMAGHASIGMAQSPAMFTPTGNLTRPRQGHSAALLTNGKVLIAGGFAFPSAWANTELYDPSTGTFTATGNMSTARYFHTATLLPDGKVLIAGGDNTLDGGCFSVWWWRRRRHQI